MNYSNGKIYQLYYTLDPSYVYIGSTIRTLAQRMGCHRNDAKKANRQNQKLYKFMNEKGIKNFKIYQIEKYPCSSKEELEKREIEVTLQFKDNGYNMLNSYCSEEERINLQTKLANDEKRREQSRQGALENRKYDREMVVKIYNMKGEMSTRDIAILFGVHNTVVHNIHNRITYSEYTSDLPDKEKFKPGLSKEIVREIYKLKGFKTKKELTELFNTTERVISHIFSKESYKEYLKDL